MLKKKKREKVLIITDSGISKLGLTKRLEIELIDAGIPYVYYDKTVANPTTDNVAEALELYHTHECQAIIGFGGGSVWIVQRPSAQKLPVRKSHCLK